MGWIVNEPNYEKFVILRVNFPNPIPYDYIENDKNYENSILIGSLIRRNNQWFVFVDRFKNLPSSDLDNIINAISEKYKELNWNNSDAEFIKRDGKLIRRKLTECSQEFFNKLSLIPGVVIPPIVGLGSDKTVLAFKYPSNQTVEITKLLMDLISNSTFDINILQMGNELNQKSLFHKFIKLNGINSEDYIIVKSIWEMKDNEITNENEGIFQNEMSFEPNFFDPDQTRLFAIMNRESSVKGMAPFKFIEEKDNHKLVQIDIRSFWFHDIYWDVLYPMGGEFYYWGYSDGQKSLENYFIIQKDNLRTFLIGLKKHWSEKPRINHKNSLEIIEGIDFTEKNDIASP